MANARYTMIRSRDDLTSAIAEIGLPMVLKSALGGYDGKGQWRLKEPTQIESVWQELAQYLAANPEQAIVAEEFVAFDREVSLVGARNLVGDVVVYPLAENVHTQGVLSLSTAIDAPALQAQAEAMFKAVAEQLNYVGVLALEFLKYKANYWSMKSHHAYTILVTGLNKAQKPVSLKTTYAQCAACRWVAPNWFVKPR